VPKHLAAQLKKLGVGILSLVVCELKLKRRHDAHQYSDVKLSVGGCRDHGASVPQWNEVLLVNIVQSGNYS
jgi:hypothetical protein